MSYTHTRHLLDTIFYVKRRLNDIFKTSHVPILIIYAIWESFLKQCLFSWCASTASKFIR